MGKKETWYFKFVHSDKSILQYRSLEKALTRFLIRLFRNDIFLLRGLLNILTLPRVYPVKTDSGWICFLVLLITKVLIWPQSSGHYSKKLFKEIIAFSIWGTWLAISKVFEKNISKGHKISTANVILSVSMFINIQDCLICKEEQSNETDQILFWLQFTESFWSFLSTFML